MATCATLAMAQSSNIGIAGNGKGVDILGQGIFETGGSAFKTPANADTNFDSLEVGNDRAQAIGAFAWGAPGGWAVNGGAVSATNDLEIKKNQNSGDCACCQALDPSCPCQDCCIKYNVEQIKVGSRSAQALGAGAGPGFWAWANNQGGVVASNTVKIVTNQE
jgi:hypothetical protein